MFKPADRLAPERRSRGVATLHLQPKEHLCNLRDRAAFLEAAGQLYDQLAAWYDEHPQASFGEIEAELRKRRRELMGTGIEVLVNGRDTGFLIEAPRCPQCGCSLEFEGYRNWTVHGLEGDVVLERAY